MDQWNSGEGCGSLTSGHVNIISKGEFIGSSRQKLVPIEYIKLWLGFSAQNNSCMVHMDQVQHNNSYWLDTFDNIIAVDDDSH